MKIVLILIAFVFASTSSELSELRKLYPKAATTKENAEIFYSKTSQISSETPLMIGYKGVGFTLKAKYESELAKKKNNFKKGVEMLEESIQKAPENIELRTLRMSVQENSPKFLNYNKNIEEDKKLIADNLLKSNSEVKSFVMQFIFTSKSFTEAEKKKYKI
jgi:hypothetical protein